MKKSLLAAASAALGILIWMIVCRMPPPAPTDSLKSVPGPSPVETRQPASAAKKYGESQAANPASGPICKEIPADTNSSLTPANPNTAQPAQKTNETAMRLPPRTVLDNCRVTIHQFHDTFGGNPVGNNAEITATLAGKNPKQINFIREDAGLELNEKGEMLDGWSTPFFFHQVSGDIMEIRSAGPDRKLWTLDDLVTR